MGSKDTSFWGSARIYAYSPFYLGGWQAFAHSAKYPRTRTGVSNPRWRQQLRDHVSATTALSGTLYTVKSHPSWVNHVRDDGGVRYSGHLAWYQTSGIVLGNGAASSTRAHERAVSRALKQIHQAQNQMSGLVFLGELKEAMHMLRHPAESLRKALKETYLDKLKRIKNKDPKRWKRAIPQTWLESSFGWRPFINDLEDAAKAYQEICDKGKDRTKPIRAIGKADPVLVQTSYFPSTGLIPGEPTKVGITIDVADEAVCVIRGAVHASANTTAIDKLRIFGLSPSEFVPTAWELLPWSFLVDYFTNIGDILEGLVTDTSSLAWISESTILTRKRRTLVAPNMKINQQGDGLHFVSYVDGGPSHCFETRRSFTRTPGVDLSVPPLRFELPGNPVQQLNMVALWAQASQGLHPQKSFRR